MNPELWFKNFNMVIELDVAGEFIYNGLQEVYQTSCFRNDAHTFVALYNLAVGIERLQKIVITLWEFKDSIRPEEFEEELRKLGHNHISLRDKIISLVKGTKAEKATALTSRENDFLEVLCHFYSDNRYMRYRAYQDTDGEVVLLKNYLTKYADTDQTAFEDVNKKRAIINIFVNCVYLYDDHYTLILNTGKKPVSKENIPFEDIKAALNAENKQVSDCSSMSSSAPPQISACS